MDCSGFAAHVEQRPRSHRVARVTVHNPFLLQLLWRARKQGGRSKHFWVGGVSEERERKGGKGKSNKAGVMHTTAAMGGGACVQTKLSWAAKLMQLHPLITSWRNYAWASSPL
jgi:hypothetical protein